MGNYRPNRAQRRATATTNRHIQRRTVDQHWVTRQGDEIACSCGKRWSVGEDHP